MNMISFYKVEVQNFIKEEFRKVQQIISGKLEGMLKKHRAGRCMEIHIMGISKHHCGGSGILHN